jgi:phage baseplate assembly protein W
MATVTTKTTRQYKDLDLSFNVHPVRKDINKHIDEQAVINSLKNIILTNHYERPFEPDFGSNIRSMLFENLDSITAITLEREILQTIENFEPRVSVTKVTAIPDYDNNGYNIKLDFLVINLTNPITIQFFLQRVR